MSFSVLFSSIIKEGDFECIDNYCLNNDISKYKTYSDLCSISLSDSFITVQAIQTSIDLIKDLVSRLMSQTENDNELRSIANFIFIKIIFSQLNEVVNKIAQSKKGYNETVSFSRQETKDMTNKTVGTEKEKEIILGTPTFNRMEATVDENESMIKMFDLKDEIIAEETKTLNKSYHSNSELCIKDMLSAVQEMKEKMMITLEERDILKEKIIERDEDFLSYLEGIQDKNELIRKMRIFLKSINE